MAKMRVKEIVYTQRVEVLMSQNGARWLDMMRYGQCYPATSEDAAKLAQIATGAMRNSAPADRRVTFIRRTLAPSEPAVERWASFDCQVVYFGEP